MLGNKHEASMEDVKIFSKNYEGIMNCYDHLLIEGDRKSFRGEQEGI